MSEIIKIDENTYRIEDDMVRIFLLLGKKEALLVDTGMNLPNAGEIAKSLTDLPIKLVNTHGDRDHISGNKAFGQFYMSENERGNYYDKNGGVGELIPVSEGDIIDLGDRCLKVIDLPGHTPGSIALLDMDNHILIGGDAIQDGRIYMFGPMRNIDKYIESLNALWEKYGNEFDIVYPSHGTFPVNKDIIPKLIGGAKEIVDGKATGTKTNFFGNDIMVYDFDYAGFLCDIK